MAALPAVNDVVMLVDERGAICRMRVEDADGVLLAVGRPLDSWAPYDGAPFDMRWGTSRGLWTMATQMWRAGDAETPLWWLEVLEEPQLHQRRSYVRAAAPRTLQPVGLTWPRSGRDVATGRLLDLSEGGARIALDTDEQPAEGERVTTVVDARDRVLELRGTVFRATRHRGETDVVVSFDRLPDALATQVRAVVFDWQRLVRR